MKQSFSKSHLSYQEQTNLLKSRNLIQLNLIALITIQKGMQNMCHFGLRFLNTSKSYNLILVATKTINKGKSYTQANIIKVKYEHFR